MTDDNLHLTADDEARIDAILHSMTEADLELEAPPDGIWDGIEAAVAAEADAAGVTLVDDHGAMIDASHRFRRPAILVAAAAALVVIIGAFVATRGADGPDYEVVGGADMVWADGFVDAGLDATAAASILVDGETDAVRLDQTMLPAAPDGEDLELWLIGVDSSGGLTIQSVGIIEDPSDDRAYEVPADFDPDAFETVLVDISFEPRDGDASHSGASVVRGPVVDA